MNRAFASTTSTFPWPIEKIDRKFQEEPPMRYTLLLFSLLALHTAPALAQNKLPACNGDIAIVRVSEITPGGTMKGFLDAATAHEAWYRKNGVKDNEIVVSRVIEKDEKTGAMKYSEKEVLTYHINPPDASRTPNRGDADWNAYVKMYRDNSDLKSEYVTCMPKHDKK
jgi:hypothetical protein